MPGAFTRTLDELGGKIVVLNQHNPSDPIGTAELSDSEMSLNAAGSLVLDLQSAKDAYTRLQNGLIDGISIGYEVLKEAYVGNVRQLQEIKLWEISLVTFPANQFARVTDVKGLLHQWADGDEIAQHFLSVLPLIKAGRELNADNRLKISGVVQVLQGMLDASDPDKGKPTPQQKAAFDRILSTIRSLNAAAKE
jgi:HK97 family phage prohead protease